MLRQSAPARWRRFPIVPTAACRNHTTARWAAQLLPAHMSISLIRSTKEGGNSGAAPIK